MKLIFSILLLLSISFNVSKANEVTDVEWSGGFLSVKYFHATGNRASCTVFNSSNKPIAGGEISFYGKVADLLISVPEKYRNSGDLYVSCEKVY